MQASRVPFAPRHRPMAICLMIISRRLVALHHVMKRLGAEGKLSMPTAVAVYLDTQTGGNGTIATVAAVIAKWPGLGAMQLKPSDIYSYVCRLPTKKYARTPLACAFPLGLAVSEA